MCPMFHVGRCGSTVLQTMLLKSGSVFADTEIYGIHTREQAAATADNAPAGDPKAAAEAFTTSRITRQTQGLGEGVPYVYEVKFLPSLDMAHFGTGLPGYLDFTEHQFGTERAIVLSRRNILRRIVSTQIAVRRGSFFDQRGSTVELPEITLPLSGLTLGHATFGLVDLIDTIAIGYRTLNAELESRGYTVLELTYEDHIESDPRVAFERVCHFLGRPALAVTPAYQRINTAPLSRTLRNFDDVANALADTPHAWMLGETATSGAATDRAGTAPVHPA